MQEFLNTDDDPLYAPESCMGWVDRLLIALIALAFVLIAFSPVIAGWLAGVLGVKP